MVEMNDVEVSLANLIDSQVDIAFQFVVTECLTGPAWVQIDNVRFKPCSPIPCGQSITTGITEGGSSTSSPNSAGNTIHLPCFFIVLFLFLNMLFCY